MSQASDQAYPCISPIQKKQTKNTNYKYIDLGQLQHVQKLMRTTINYKKGSYTALSVNVRTLTKDALA